MEKIQELKEAIESCLAIEVSDRVKGNVSYGDLFINGELNPKHVKFPISSLSTLTPAEAKERIIFIYKTYSEQGFFDRLWWRIKKTESIDTYAKLYNIIKLHDFKTELERIPSNISVNLTSFISISQSLLHVFLDYLSSFLPSHGFFTRLFEGHYMRLHTDILAIPTAIESFIEVLVKPTGAVPTSKTIEADLNHIDKNLEFGFQHFNSGDILQSLADFQGQLDKIKIQGIPEQYQELYAKLAQKLKATFALLEALQDKKAIAPLMPEVSKAPLEKAIASIEEQMQRVQYNCSIQRIAYKAIYKPQAFTYYIELDKNNTIKKIKYYGKDAEEEEKRIPIPNHPTDKEKDIETALYKRHQSQMKVNYADNPPKRLEVFNKINIQECRNNLIQAYSLKALQELSEEKDTKNASSYANNIWAYNAFITRRFAPLLERYHQTQALLQKEKSEYEQVLALIPAFRKKALLVIINAYSHTNIKAELEKLLQNELIEVMNKVPALSLITKKQILTPIVSFLALLNKSSEWEPDFSYAIVGVFTKPTSPWYINIEQQFKSIENAKYKEDFLKLIEETAISCFELILKEQSYHTSDLSFAVDEIRNLKIRYKTQWEPPAEFIAPAQKPAISLREVRCMPADTMDAWNNWLIEERQHPRTLKQAFDKLAEYVKTPTNNAQTNLMRYIFLVETALRLVEANKWLHLGMKESPEEIIQVLKGILNKVYGMLYHPDKNVGKDAETIKINNDLMVKFNGKNEKGCKAIRKAVNCEIEPSWIREKANSLDFWREVRAAQQVSTQSTINDLMRMQRENNEEQKRLKIQFNQLRTDIQRMFVESRQENQTLGEEIESLRQSIENINDPSSASNTI